MSCTLSTGISTLDCIDQVGGIETLYFTEYENKDTTAFTLSGQQVTAMELLTGKQFWEFKVEVGSAKYDSTGNRDPKGGWNAYTSVITFPVNKMGYTKSALLKTLSQNRLMCIAKLNTGDYILLGYNFGGFVSYNTGSGDALASANAYSVTFTAEDKVDAYYVSSGLISALTAPAS